MFAHIYKYRLKCILRDRQTMFWTLMFPLILGTFFFMAISNITSNEAFSEIKIAFTDEGGSNEYEMLRQVIQGLSEGGGEEKSLFDVTYTTREEADRLLAEGSIKGYIYYDSEIRLAVKERGLGQTVIKSVIDDFKQSASTFSTIIENDPSSAEGLFADIADRTDYLSEVTMGRAAPDTTVNYFYTLIAMMCFYGGFLGLKEVSAVQANQSSEGARVNFAPTHKLKVFFVSMLAAVTIQLLETAVLLAYLIFILRIDFGNQIAYILITCIIGSLAGVTFGACVAAVMKTGEGPKVAVLISASMLMSFLSGMMYHGMKTIVRNFAPILSYINPLNLIADSLYSLYYYQTNARFFTNIILLTGFTALFSLLTYLVIRRQKYASL